MFKSLSRYLNYFTITFLFRPERKILFNHLTKRYVEKKYTNAEKKQSLNDAIKWLCHAQGKSNDSGFCTYRIVEGWSSSYPETSGYIIPTLLEYAVKYNHESVVKNLIDCANWLLSIQKSSGGWQSMYVEDNRPEIVFNTGQVVRGMIAVYKYTNEKKYLNAAIKACNWLCNIQEEDGSWQKHAFMNTKRVYDSYVSEPLLQLHAITQEERYKQAAIKNLYWIIEKKQKNNGWLEDCDNTIKHNDKPVLHTIAYTIDGLLDSGIYLNDTKLVSSAQKTADQLLHIFERKQELNGRYDKDWNGSQYMICTGCAQISIVWMKLYKKTNDGKYYNAASKMNALLIYIQKQNDGENTKGALPGSFPVWGRYEPFSFPNWGTKYFADALMLELAIMP